MKKLLISATVLACFAAPAFAEPASIEIKVPLAPSAVDVVEAHQAVLDAAKTVCAQETYPYSLLVSRQQAEAKCVEMTYSQTVKDGQAAKLAVFTDTAPLEGTQFE